VLLAVTLAIWREWLEQHRPSEPVQSSAKSINIE
jgi:hypothetical protein